MRFAHHWPCLSRDELLASTEPFDSAKFVKGYAKEGMTRIRNWLQFAVARSPLRQMMRHRVPSPLLRYLRMQTKECQTSKKQRPINAPKEKQRKSHKARQLVRATWAGFGSAGASELEAIIADETRPAREIAEATWALSHWYASTGQHECALNKLRRLTGPIAQDDCRKLFLEAETLLRLTRVVEAKALIDEAISRLGEVPELCLAAANALAYDPNLPQWERDRLRLEWLNKPFLSAGLMPLRLKNCRNSLSLENIVPRQTGAGPEGGSVKVSVLMAAYNAESTVATAIESILGQTWANLELVVVDDGSSDQTWHTIQLFAAGDLRVVALRHGNNRGTYPARNTALAAASGEFLTVQDADDWSHPQRLALQVKSLLQSEQLLNSTDLIRVDSHLRARFNRDGTIIGENQSSLMTRRQFVLELGGWDQSRMGADDEFHRRLLLRHRLEKNRIQRSLPLCFARIRDDSLTARPEIGVNTNQYGARREYLEAFQHWHQLEVTKGSPDLLKLPVERPFPIPNVCKPGSSQPVIVHLLLVSDLSLSETVTSFALSILRLANRRGFDCGCFHWPRLLSAGSRVNSIIRQLLHDQIAKSVVAGEAVTARLVVVSDPILLRHLPDRLPIVRTDRCVVLVDDGHSAQEVERAFDNAYTAFGVSPVLAPTSSSARKTLLARGDQYELTAFDWTQLDPGESVSPSECGRHDSAESFAITTFEECVKPYLVTEDSVSTVREVLGDCSPR